ncbi:MAG: polysaccharide pyruvyl transferase WcaK-like protein [Kiritimatiellia bacterium]|jgi:polysaccharide pyruvyl transferase WcaK-like protein
MHMKTLLQRIADRAVSGAKKATDADLALQGSMAALIEVAATRYAFDPGQSWRPGKPYRLLLAGYSGVRNTGADARVEEMIRQFRHLFGDENLDLSILTIDPAGSRGYFPTAKQLLLPKIFPAWLASTVRQQHGVIACEGSMFKSKFANALATMMTGSLGLAAAEGKLAVGYGGEAGRMDPSLERLVERYCRDTLQICRNENSASILGKLGIECKVGTDTAWTYQPRDLEHGRTLLREAGWDGVQPVIAFCPINPFWWPVKADLQKAVENRLTGAHEDAHYASVYFHNSGPEVDRKQVQYLTHLVQAARAFRDRHNAFVILYGSEALDRRAAEVMAPMLGGDVPLFVSDELDHGSMIATLWNCDVVVSSRYHAIVCSMAGKPVSVGVTMDERIRNLMDDRGTPELSLEVDDPNLGEHLIEQLEHVWRDKDGMRAGIDRTVVKNLELLGKMGGMLVDRARSIHPDLPFRAELGEHGDPWAHLPPLGDRVRDLVERHG